MKGRQHLAERRRRILDQAFAGLGQGHAAGRAHEQNHAQLGFQLPYRLADGRS
jgi:hypothetical protein